MCRQQNKGSGEFSSVSRIFIHFLGTRWEVLLYISRPNEQWAQGHFALTSLIIVAMMWYLSVASTDVTGGKWKVNMGRINWATKPQPTMATYWFLWVLQTASGYSISIYCYYYYCLQNGKFTMQTSANLFIFALWLAGSSPLENLHSPLPDV